MDDTQMISAAESRSNRDGGDTGDGIDPSVAPRPRTGTVLGLLVTAALVPATPAQAQGGFSTQGNQILGPSGAPFVMRGVNVLFETQVGGLYGGASAVNAHINAIASTWGFNSIRLEVSENLWIGSQQQLLGTTTPNPFGYCAADAGYIANIDAWVATATAANLLTVIDLHTNTHDGTTDCGLMPQRLTMPDAAIAPTFWQQVAARYADNPYVAFELYNEPQCVTPQVWHDGGTVFLDSCAGSGATYQAAGMQSLYETVRAEAPTNLVLVEGIRNAGQPTPGGYDIAAVQATPITANPAKGIALNNLVYASHIYKGNNCGTLPGDLAQKVTSVAATKPVVIDEFGSGCAVAAGAASFLAQVINYAHQNGLGYSAFAWDVYGCVGLVCNYGLVKAFSGGNAWQASVPGVPVKNDL
jgi:hypothetical protein